MISHDDVADLIPKIEGQVRLMQANGRLLPFISCAERILCERKCEGIECSECPGILDGTMYCLSPQSECFGEEHGPHGSCRLAPGSPAEHYFRVWRYMAQEELMSIDPAAPDEGIRIEPRESIRRRILGL
jgi:hypothetical protein